MSKRSEERKFYTAYEKKLLTKLVEKFQSIVESKRYDAINIQKKREAWNKICAAYNSQDVLQRTPKQLKKLWDNMKQKTRKSNNMKDEISKSGEDPLSMEDNNIVFDEVRSVAPEMKVEVENYWGDTGSCRIDCTSTSLDFEEEDKKFQIDSSSLSDHNCQVQSGQIDSWEMKRKTEENDIDSLSKRIIGEEIPNRLIQEEYSLKLQKIQEAIGQQRELHNYRVQAAIAEKRYWDTKTSFLNNNSPA